MAGVRFRRRWWRRRRGGRHRRLGRRNGKITVPAELVVHLHHSSFWNCVPLFANILWFELERRFPWASCSISGLLLPIDVRSVNSGIFRNIPHNPPPFRSANLPKRPLTSAFLRRAPVRPQSCCPVRALRATPLRTRSLRTFKEPCVAFGGIRAVSPLPFGSCSPLRAAPILLFPSARSSPLEVAAPSIIIFPFPPSFRHQLDIHGPFEAEFIP